MVSIDALILLGMASVGLDRHLEAIHGLDQVLVIDSGNVRAHASRALAYTNLGQNAQTSEDADHAVELGGDRAAMNTAIEQIKKRR